MLTLNIISLPDDPLTAATVVAALLGAGAIVIAALLSAASTIGVDWVRRQGEARAAARSRSEQRERILGQLAGLASAMSQVQYVRAHTRVLSGTGAAELQLTDDFTMRTILAADIRRLSGEGDALLIQSILLEREFHEIIAIARTLWVFDEPTEALVCQLAAMEFRDLAASVTRPAVSTDHEERETEKRRLAAWRHNEENRLTAAAWERYERPLTAIRERLRASQILLP